MSTANKLDGSRGQIIREFREVIQKSIEWDELKDVDFAMWLPCEEDRQFARSPITVRWTTIYSITSQYGSYVTADILKTLGLVDEQIYRMALPDTFQPFAFLTTDGEQVVLSLSQEKGLRLHFAATTSLAYQVQFLDNFIAYCNAWKELVLLNNGLGDEDPGFGEWWSFMVKTSTAVEQNEPLMSVGKIVK